MSTAHRLETGLTAATAGFALAALARPEWLSGDDASDGQTYYARMYAARALPLAVAVFSVARNRRRAPEVLAVAASAQFGDVLVGVFQGKLQQAVPTALAGAVYARLALRQRRSVAEG